MPNHRHTIAVAIATASRGHRLHRTNTHIGPGCEWPHSVDGLELCPNARVYGRLWGKLFFIFIVVSVTCWLRLQIVHVLAPESGWKWIPIVETANAPSTSGGYVN